MYFCWVVNMGMDLLKEALEKALDLSRFDVEAVRLLLAWTCRKSDKHIRSLREPSPYAHWCESGRVRSVCFLGEYVSRTLGSNRDLEGFAAPRG